MYFNLKGKVTEEEYQKYFFCTEELAEVIRKNQWAEELDEAPNWFFKRINQKKESLSSMYLFKVNNQTPKDLRVRAAHRYIISFSYNN
tara:strand:- start:963 stop:1226 length:264 start_codon:yes stop_codon:yes gene_type:complete